MRKSLTDHTESLHDIVMSIPDDMSIYKWFLYFLRILDKIWHYPIVAGENQTIALSNLVIASLLLYFGVKVAKSLSRQIYLRFISRLDIERSAAQAFEKATYYGLIVIISFIVLDIANIPLTAFTFVGGALAIGLGFGTQQILNNFVSGIIIMMEQPIRIGDIIEVSGSGTNLSGIVTNIAARCTHIVTGDNIDVIIPNSTLLQNTIINYTLSGEGTIRHAIEFKVSQENDINKVSEILESVIYSQNNILEFPEPQILLINVEERLLTYKITFWIDLRADISRAIIVSNIYNELFREMKANNIELNAPLYMYGE
ncbi:MAG: mechanosensitive ion channel [Alphaproteobacteria bacterium]|nr:mechanosensitive ion channel [Alphaproteobacteria bacterium]OJV14136.1 MAG: hypothetical protein BGO27_01450 [Alphaproteobacteria bacterium 33-17]